MFSRDEIFGSVEMLEVFKNRLSRFRDASAVIYRAVLNSISGIVVQFRMAKVHLRKPPESEQFIGSGSVRPRDYETYESYVVHQRSKVESWRHKRETNFAQKDKFAQHFEKIEEVKKSRVAICLGARWGEECAALTSLGVLAIGVDLNPDNNNQYVVAGDFHKLQFPSGSFDLAYTNVWDHVLKPEDFVAEVGRVLAVEHGKWLIDVYLGWREKAKVDRWGALSYETTQDVVDLILSTGHFSLIREVDAFGGSYRSYLLRKKSEDRQIDQSDI